MTQVTDQPPYFYWAALSLSFRSVILYLQSLECLYFFKSGKEQFQLQILLQYLQYLQLFNTFNYQYLHYLQYVQYLQINTCNSYTTYNTYDTPHSILNHEL